MLVARRNGGVRTAEPAVPGTSVISSVLCKHFYYIDISLFMVVSSSNEPHGSKSGAASSRRLFSFPRENTLLSSSHRTLHLVLHRRQSSVTPPRPSAKDQALVYVP